MAPTRREVLVGTAGIVGLAMAGRLARAEEPQAKKIGLLVRWGERGWEDMTMWEVFENADGTLRQGDADLMEERV